MNRKAVVIQLTVGIVAVLLLAGCALPFPMPSATVPQASDGAAAATPEGTVDPLAAEGSVMATVATRSLRVRQTPNENSEVVAGIAEGESYRVLALSEDGLWVQLAVDSAPDGNGWVSTNFVTVEGDISQLTGSTEEAAASSPAATADVTLVPTPQSGYAIVNTDGVRLRVRSGPSTDNPIVGYAYDGESYQILETSEDGAWVRIPAAS
ncbi:MAG: SH3 domain-containing protein, partial [Caldilineaceae bacterium]|nr:SH3 domain-containing protein [Caldilineaceae bacterium]